MYLEEDSMHALGQGLAGYLRAVAGELDLPPQGTSFEISDTATAYVALVRRTVERPGQDLMLVWSENAGWAVAVETDPRQPPAVIAYFGEPDPVPDATAVAAFVRDVLDGRRNRGQCPNFTPNNRAELARRLATYADHLPHI